MAKTDLTLKMEQMIWALTHDRFTGYGCFEVDLGGEIVDYMTMDSKGVARCYEIKVTKSDFRSKAALSFIGHYNYFVLPDDLYQKVRDEIPAHVGVYTENGNVKPAKRQAPKMSAERMFFCMMRTMAGIVARYEKQRGESLDAMMIQREKTTARQRALRKETKQLRQQLENAKQAAFDYKVRYRVAQKRLNEARIGGGANA